jgi:hypothetical protein
MTEFQGQGDDIPSLDMFCQVQHAHICLEWMLREGFVDTSQFLFWSAEVDGERVVRLQSISR